jgi:salicylate hydroxylase
LIALTDGTTLIDLDLLSVAEEPGLRIRWADLYAVLRLGSAASTTFDRALEDLEEDASGRLIPVFRDANGELIRHGAFDLLVAADGRYSRLREILDGPPDCEFLGIGTWRLLFRNATDIPVDDYGQYFCGNARLLAFRLPNDSVYIAGSFPYAGTGPIPDELKTAAAQRRFFQPRSAAASTQVEWMLSVMDCNFGNMTWARTQEIPTMHHGMDGRVLLLGDAAHATFQTLGQGATQAIEDALAVIPASCSALLELVFFFSYFHNGGSPHGMMPPPGLWKVVGRISAWILVASVERGSTVSTFLFRMHLKRANFPASDYGNSRQECSISPPF